MTKAQYDMFGLQEDFLPAEPVSYAPDPDRVRGKLESVLKQLRNAGNMPWDGKTLRYHRKVFPQMTTSLPEDEAAQYRLEFEKQLQRLSEE